MTGERLDPADLIPERYHPPKPVKTEAEKQAETRSALRLMGAMLGDTQPLW